MEDYDGEWNRLTPELYYLMQIAQEVYRGNTQIDVGQRNKSKLDEFKIPFVKVSSEEKSKPELVEPKTREEQRAAALARKQLWLGMLKAKWDNRDRTRKQ